MINVQKDELKFYLYKVLNNNFHLYLQAQCKLEIQAWWSR